jgi:transposase
VYYHTDASRGQKVGEYLLGDFNGTLMSAGYGVYEALARAGPQMHLDGSGGKKIKHVFCWAHVRRKFYDLREKHPDECGYVLNLVGELYAT